MRIVMDINPRSLYAGIDLSEQMSEESLNLIHEDDSVVEAAEEHFKNQDVTLDELDEYIYSIYCDRQEAIEDHLYGIFGTRRW